MPQGYQTHKFKKRASYKQLRRVSGFCTPWKYYNTPWRTPAGVNSTTDTFCKRRYTEKGEKRKKKKKGKAKIEEKEEQKTKKKSRSKENTYRSAIEKTGDGELGHRYGRRLQNSCVVGCRAALTQQEQLYVFGRLHPILLQVLLYLLAPQKSCPLLRGVAAAHPASYLLHERGEGCIGTRIQEKHSSRTRSRRGITRMLRNTPVTEQASERWSLQISTTHSRRDEPQLTQLEDTRQNTSRCSTGRKWHTSRYLCGNRWRKLRQFLSSCMWLNLAAKTLDAKLPSVNTFISQIAAVRNGRTLPVRDSMNMERYSFQSSVAGMQGARAQFCSLLRYTTKAQITDLEKINFILLCVPGFQTNDNTTHKHRD